MANKFKKAILSAVCVLLSVMFLTAPTVLASEDEIKEPVITHSTAYLVYCIEPDTVLTSKNADARVYPAALTKLMTAVLAAEYVNDGKMGLDDYVTASQAALKGAEGNLIDIKVGEEIRLRDLIAAMIHKGANDAALVIAERIGGSVSSFVAMMNQRAADLGMKNTRFTNPTGLHDNGMITTANDLLELAKHASRIQIISEIAKNVRITISATNKSNERVFGTRNYLISTRVSKDYYVPSANGLICGSTYEAGFCVIATAQKDGLNYIVITMGADESKIELTPPRVEVDDKGNTVVIEEGTYKYVMNGFVEAGELIEWAESGFGYIKAVDTSTVVCEMPIKLGDGIDSIVLLPESSIEAFVPSSVDPKRDIELKWTLDSEYLTAPVKAGQRVGTVEIFLKGEKLGEVPLVSRTNVAQHGGLRILSRAEQLIKTPFFKLLIIASVLGIVVYVLFTAYTRSRRRAAAKKEYMRKTRYLNK